MLATEGCKDAEFATTTAIGLARRTDSELHVVHVGSVVPEHYEPTDVEPARFEQEARSTLEEQVRKIETLGGTIAGSHLRMGGVADEIVKLVQELGIGLVVLGSRRKGRIKRLTMGSVSSSIVAHAHCPVIVVREVEQV